MTDTQNQKPESNGAGQEEEDEQTAAAREAELPAATLEDRLAALQAERDDTKDRMLRIAADFENWKKRSRKEQTDGEARVRESVLKDMLEVVDNLERATSAYVENGSVDGASVLKGVNLVLRLFHSKLERYSVKPFEAKGQPFDPRVHEAISQVPTADVAPGTVANELQKGYRIGDKLLRPAIVAVATAPASAKTQKAQEPEEQG
jgi:molecular chaperone GrpE